MSSHLRRLAGECGETLIEVIIAMLIMGVVLVAIFAGLATSISTSTFHKQQATAQTIARDFGEYMQYTASYNACTGGGGGVTSYSSDVSNFKSTYTLPGGAQPLTGGSPTYAVQIKDVAYWDGQTSPAGFSTCPSSGDLGAQRFTLEVTSTSDSRVDEILQVVKRQAT